MEKSIQWLNRDDGAKLFLRRWSPQGSPRAVLQIVHGMAEHSLRYEGLADTLCSAGIDVWAADQRGHGKTADLSVNDAGHGGQLGHCADRNGFSAVISDIDAVFDRIEQTYGGENAVPPLFLLGHSWGSFLAQGYAEHRGSRLRGCMLSGTRGPDGLKISAGAPVISLAASVKGVRKPSSFIYAMVDGPYNKPFRPNRTRFDWLSRDEREVDAYIADPLCGFMCSGGFYRDMIQGLKAIHREESMMGIPRDLPLYIFCGSADPVGDMGTSPTALVNAYKKLEIADLEFVLYPDARHETLNETNREEVTTNLLAWIEKHLVR
ncbi:alpha/beta hydrolase [Breznakiella homolactica]|uniref:Lysophospholipase n=1 Tax=Breznakiella homolactica TaxID=2798577 RepID=A0A7T7XKM4_9SPIR|nr:alpha/beta hydrolase [Breznakiella homolactica]QQO07942.1 lysophospholipase [Breznakiella homolactica]